MVFGKSLVRVENLKNFGDLRVDTPDDAMILCATDMTVVVTIMAVVADSDLTVSDEPVLMPKLKFRNQCEFHCCWAFFMFPFQVSLC